MLLNRVCTILSQARTGPPRRSESNESIDHLQLVAAGIGNTVAKDRLVSERIRIRSIMVRPDGERTGCRVKGRWAVSIIDAPVGQLLHRYQATTLVTTSAPMADFKARWVGTQPREAG
jgi:hypothetical protein